MPTNSYKTTIDFSALYTSLSDPQMKRDEKISHKLAARFIKKWQNQKSYLTDPKKLKEALDDYGHLFEKYGLVDKAWYFLSLLSQLDQLDTKVKAKFSKVRDVGKKLQNDIQFFILNLSKVDKTTQVKMLQSKAILPYKHFLEQVFAEGKYTLSDPEEKILNLTSTAAYSNWVKMTTTFLAKEEGQVINSKGQREQKPFADLVNLMNNTNKKTRDSAAVAFNMIVKKHIDIGEHELNSILQYKKVNDDLRQVERPDIPRHLSDDIDTQVVDTLVDTVASHYAITKKYYTLKAKLLGVKALAYHERNVPIGNLKHPFTFDKCVQIITEVLQDLDPEFYTIFESLLKNGQIDVYPKKGKVSGASCWHNLITHPTYIILNWGDSIYDCLTFAHELGHAINNELIKKRQGPLNFGTPTSTAEVASTFFEDFVLQKLLSQANDEERLILLTTKLNEDVSTIIRQVAFYKFETELHTDFRQKGYLTHQDIGSLFTKHASAYMGNHVEQSAGSENWWLYVTHFRSFFYVYSYASGLLISKALQNMVKTNPKTITKVKDFLATGLSDSPQKIFARLGIDISDKGFWEKGLAEVANLLTESETLAKKLGKI